MTEPKNIKTCTFCKAEFDDRWGDEICRDCFKKCELCGMPIDPNDVLCHLCYCDTKIQMFCDDLKKSIGELKTILEDNLELVKYLENKRRPNEEPNTFKISRDGS